LKKQGYAGKTICDVGCGNGVNTAFLKSLGFDIYGVEVTDAVVEVVKSNLDHLGVQGYCIKTGTNANIPFEEERFDYLLSWGACYYMGDGLDFSKHVEEFARVLKLDGTCVLCIPKKSCFIFKGSETLTPGYQIIRNDPFNVRHGEVLRMFEDEADIEKAFSSHFTDFVFGSIHDDCFGFDYHWHLVVCKKR
jgi:SAM-dependent methyltransferase